MRILEVIDIGYEAGGAEKSVKLIRDTLQAKGHEVFVLSTDTNSKGKQVFADALIPAIRGSGPVRLGKYFWNPAAYKKARSVIRDFQPDVVHLHTICEFSPAIIWGIGHVPMILTIHGPEEFTRKLLPWVLPASDYAHSSYQWRDLSFIGRLRYNYLRYLQRPAYLLPLRRNLKLVLAPSKYMAQAVQCDFPHTPMLQVYNGIALPTPLPLPDSDHGTVLYVGRLEVVKGVDYLIRAFAIVHRTVPSSRLRIVGDGPQASILKTLVKELGLSKYVEFPGWVLPEHIVNDEYRNAQLLVIPSVWPENLPTVAIEALATGRPIVGSNTGGIPELIDTGGNGFIVEPRNTEALADAISKLLTNSRMLSSAAKASVVKSRTFAHIPFVDRLIDVYSGVINENTHS